MLCVVSTIFRKRVRGENDDPASGGVSAISKVTVREIDARQMFPWVNDWVRARDGSYNLSNNPTTIAAITARTNATTKASHSVSRCHLVGGTLMNLSTCPSRNRISGSTG